MVKYIILFIGLAAVTAVVHIFLPGLRVRIGSSNVATRLSLLPKSDYIVISDIPVKTSKGQMLIKHVVVSRYGVFVILVKNIPGRIFGSETEERWTQRYFNSERTFRNPLFRCHRQISLIRLASGCTKKSFFPVIVFTGGASVWVNSSLDITTPRYLNKRIRAHDRPILSEDEVQNIAIKLSELHYRQTYGA
ncbi:MAG: NERD domain-containing protein [Oscillospiraceae bacterium]|nr:NERD domain-containing protein [Oscillospiraceae bacterium]